MSERYQFQAGEEYLAKPIGMMYSEIGHNKTPAFKVAFLLDTEEGPKRCDWAAWLSPKAKDKTVATVTNMLGWNGSMETDENGVFTDENVLDWESQVKVTVKYNDKGYPEIEWVNGLGGAKFSGAVKVEARRGMELLGLKAAYLDAKKKSGNPQQQQAPQQQQKRTNLPF